MSVRFAIFLLLVACGILENPLWALGKPTYALELDPYYSDVYIDIPFKKDAGEAPIEKGEEIKTYEGMLKKAFVPQFLTLEASINPLPITGVFIRKNINGFYRNSQVTPSLNIVEAVTAGFEEPYALSVFLGKVVDFDTRKSTVLRRKKGYTGFLASFGTHHIISSLMVKDPWLELEWKVKGDLETEARLMSWSFRVGSKFHGNSEIADVYYLGIRRNRIDYKKTKLSFLLSSGIEYRVDVDKDNFEAISHYLMLDKNFTVGKQRWALSLGIGYLWRGAEKYKGSLAASREQSKSQILIRPNIRF